MSRPPAAGRARRRESRNSLPIDLHFSVDSIDIILGESTALSYTHFSQGPSKDNRRHDGAKPSTYFTRNIMLGFVNPSSQREGSQDAGFTQPSPCMISHVCITSKLFDVLLNKH